MILITIQMSHYCVTETGTLKVMYHFFTDLLDLIGTI